MDTIIIIISCLVCGMVLGRLLRGKLFFLRISDKIALAAIYVLLFSLGAGLGDNSDLLGKLPVLGGRAIVTTILCVIGSILAINFLVLMNIFPQTGEAGKKVEKKGGPSPLKGTIRILCFFILGIILAYTGILPKAVIEMDIATQALYLLVFAVGIGLGADLKAFGVVRDMHVKILLVPFLVVVGSLSGGALAGIILPDFSVKDGLCVGAGFGYYSLSSILIENSGNAPLASVALMSNIFREVLTILLTPLMARFCGRLSPVASGGAAAMDTCLPGIARFCGERYAVTAVFSGTCLTILVPFLVTALIYW